MYIGWITRRTDVFEKSQRAAKLISVRKYQIVFAVFWQLFKMVGKKNEPRNRRTPSSSDVARNSFVNERSQLASRCKKLFEFAASQGHLRMKQNSARKDVWINEKRSDIQHLTITGSNVFLPLWPLVGVIRADSTAIMPSSSLRESLHPARATPPAQSAPAADPELLLFLVAGARLHLTCHTNRPL